MRIIEETRKKEMHHRIKNTLQVITFLLDLQMENFSQKEAVQIPEVLETLRESQNRVMSMALIHEELYENGGNDTLNFSLYLKKLSQSLFQTYKVGNANITLNLDTDESIFFNMTQQFHWEQSLMNLFQTLSNMPFLKSMIEKV